MTIKNSQNSPFMKHFYSQVSPTEFAPPTLYHYTGAEGVKGILLDGFLWATNFSFLNDPSEVEYGRNLVLDVLRDTQETSCAATKTVGAIEDSFNRLISEVISEVYIFSLTTCLDDLSQWRAYGSAAAVRYCIGFDFEAISELVSAQNYMVSQNDLALDETLSLSEVIYWEQNQREEVQWWIDRAILAAEEHYCDFQDIVEFVANGLARLVPRLKDPAYEKEKEWRIIRWVPTDSVSEVCFTTTRGIIRPYVKLPIAHEEGQIHGQCEKVSKPQSLPVTKLLILAPRREDISVKAADMLLRKAGIMDVKAEKSKVPFAE